MDTAPYLIMSAAVAAVAAVLSLLHIKEKHK
jgi:hypothetical protein